MSTAKGTDKDSGSTDRPLDPMDTLEFQTHEMALFARVVASFANDLMEEFRGPLQWKVEALAMLCDKTGKMAQELCQMTEEARGNAP